MSGVALPEAVEEHHPGPAAGGCCRVGRTSAQASFAPSETLIVSSCVESRAAEADPPQTNTANATARRTPSPTHDRTLPRLYDARMDPRPVGVFDSGVGGLTVLHECLVTMPHEDFVYLGDHARLPYGPRPLEEIRGFAREIGAYLEQQDVKLIVVACNTATSAALPQLQEELAVPVIGVITPEAHAAVQATRNRHVGLLATAATVDAGRYDELVHALDAGISFYPVACPRLVPLIEGDDPYGEETEARGARVRGAAARRRASTR